jgi:hypothetical protein
VTKEHLSWVSDLLNSSGDSRVNLKKKILENIKNTKETKELYKLLTSSEVDFVGFAPNIYYAKATASQKDYLESLWVHPFGLPMLLFYHKPSCCLIVAGPGLRFNDTILNENPKNKTKIRAEGITG